MEISLILLVVIILEIILIIAMVVIFFILLRKLKELPKDINEVDQEIENELKEK